MITVLKLGGELLEDLEAIRSAAEAIVSLAAATPLVVVHGGGRAIDAELRARGESPRFVDGLRITDEAALDAVCERPKVGSPHITGSLTPWPPW